MWVAAATAGPDVGGGMSEPDGVPRPVFGPCRASVDRFRRVSYDCVMATDPIFQKALSLSPEERVRLIDDLLESVVANDSGDELDQAQKAELLRRLAADRAKPGAAIPWDQAQRQIKRPA